MKGETRILLRVEQTEDGTIKLSKVIEYGNGTRVMVPIIRDGSVKWFDDTKLIKTEYRK
ncbi:hypothetical protein [Enterocloster citroniae]|uniref:Uncharacterized protein n=1 Tax=[Clostridium] citroniae WAL-17108 TaxID=742733 RepID=G5HQK0_9FIRM|nr:hypothetical protein [Enterocloster citroniae]EHE96326.1 hypothetical protein HMPREF9469_04862 [ [[Clostridium] citroniae WAL-17108]